MIDKNISIHLQDFPNLSFIKNEENLVKNMDLVRLICSTALSIRDQKNLRVRLPLNKLTIIGKDVKEIKDFKDIIADEVNVKSVEIQENLNELAELTLKINFKKIGAKLGSKIKEIMTEVKAKNFTQISENKIEIAGITLIDDDFELKLSPKNNQNPDEEIIALPDNSCLIALETKLTDELKNEGIARDIVRAVQQARKDADLDVSDKITLNIFADNKITQAIKDFENYIKEQVLATKISITKDLSNIENSANFSSQTKIEDGDLALSIEVN